jgi:hypothetical protein
MNQTNSDSSRYSSDELATEHKFAHAQVEPTRPAPADGLKDIEKKPRTPGYWKDLVKMSEDFDDPLPPEILAGFGLPSHR